MHKKNEFCMLKIFFGRCFFAYKIRFAVKKKQKNFWGKFSKLFVCKKSQSYNFHIWKFYDKHFLHTLDVWNCIIMIFVAWNGMITIFGVWRSTWESSRVVPRLSKKTEYISLGCFCSGFRRKRNIYTRCVFFIQSVLADRNNSFLPNFSIPYWRYRLSGFKFKKIFYPQFFWKVLGVWKLPNWPYSGLNYGRFEDFIHIFVSVTQIIYTWKIIPLSKIVPNWIEAS